MASLDSICSALAGPGYAVIPDFISNRSQIALRHELLALTATNGLQAAGIGRGNDHRLSSAVRGDQIYWLDGASPAQARWLRQMQRLQRKLNRSLYLGLNDYESQFAHFAPGTFYRRHLDSFVGRESRMVSTVLYLNRNWHERDGGCLTLFDPVTGAPLRRLLPLGGTLVIFMSELIPHEVEVTHRARLSIAGWFRRDSGSAALSGATIKPPPQP